MHGDTPYYLILGRRRRSDRFVLARVRGTLLMWSEDVPHPIEMERISGSVEEWIVSFLKKRDAREAKKATASAVQVSEWSRSHPALWEYLTLEEYPDGTPRDRSMLCAFVENGSFKACLQDRDAQMSLWASGPSLEAVLEALEAKCASGDESEWRSMGGVTKNKKRR